MRNITITEGEYYHLFNRGMKKQTIFHDKFDYCRFLYSLMTMQSLDSSTNATYDNKSFARNLFNKHSVLINNDKTEKIVKSKTVDILAFILMPNHFHLLVRETKENGISTMMQRLLNSYTKYLNIKYETSGHLFQGPYRIVHVNENEQLLYTSAYIHRNCRELKNWKNKEAEYFWSSYPDYSGKNRWGKLLNTELIMEQFDDSREYQKYVNESGAKEVEYDIPFQED